jgi:hypothetical protein
MSMAWPARRAYRTARVRAGCPSYDTCLRPPRDKCARRPVPEIGRTCGGKAGVGEGRAGVSAVLTARAAPPPFRRSRAQLVQQGVGPVPSRQKARPALSLRGVSRALPNASVRVGPLADISTRTCDPLHRPRPAHKYLTGPRSSPRLRVRSSASARAVRRQRKRPPGETPQGRPFCRFPSPLPVMPFVG